MPRIGNKPLSFYRADYVDHSGTPRRAYVRVHTTIADDGTGRTVWYAYHPYKLGCGKNAGSHVDAVARLINDHGRIAGPVEEMPPSPRDIRQLCSTAYQNALAEARRTYGKGFYRSRGRYVFVSGADECFVAWGDWEWRGTAADMVRLEAYMANPATISIHIEGGIDYAPTLVDLNDGFSEPWAAEWSVTLWDVMAVATGTGGAQ